jgi:hypothetical protein
MAHAAESGKRENLADRVETREQPFTYLSKILQTVRKPASADR